VGRDRETLSKLVYIGAGYLHSLHPALQVTVRNLSFDTAWRFGNGSLVWLLYNNKKKHV